MSYSNQSVILSLSKDQFRPSFPNSIWERNCPRNSIAPTSFYLMPANQQNGRGSATELPQQARSQIEFGNEEADL